jgi:transcriptional regulator with XRE-family HTH domain
LKSVFTREYGQFLAALIDARKAKHLSQQELAARPGKPQSFVSKYERGERRLDVIEFLYVARALGLSATEIISDLESKPPAPGEGAQ